MKIQLHRTPILEGQRLTQPKRRHTATKAEAEVMDREAIRIIDEMRSGWLRLGLLLQKMIDARAYAALGYPSMHSWMNARLGQSMSAAFSAMRSVRALNGVPEEKLQQIGERNAHALTYLPTKERKRDEWLDKAARLSTKEFKQEVAIAIEKKTGLPRERFKTFAIALPETVYEYLCEAEKKLALTLCVDIETNPPSRILVWEALAQWILQMDEETIKTHTQGL